MTKLSQFMTDMRDTENIVGVKEEQLREYVKQAREWEKLVEMQNIAIKELKGKIFKLREDIELYKIENRRLKKQSIETIDLTA